MSMSLGHRLALAKVTELEQQLAELEEENAVLRGRLAEQRQEIDVRDEAVARLLMEEGSGV